MNVSDPVSCLPGVGSFTQKKLEKLGILTVNDLIQHTPNRFEDFTKKASSEKELRPGEKVTLQGQIIYIKNIRTKTGKTMQLGELQLSNEEKIQLVWFNRPFLTRSLPPQKTVNISGKVGWFGRKKAIISPSYEVVELENIHTGALIPIYPETKGINSKFLRKIIKKALNETSDFADYLPEKIRETYELEPKLTAINNMHFPKNPSDFYKARQRFAFDELLLLQLENLKRKNLLESQKVALKLKVDRKLVDEFLNSLPFKLTSSQQKAIDEILSDLKSERPMNRLLQGDVGSGKTIVALTAVLVAYTNNTNAVVIAPTQILAEQHFKTFTNYFAKIKDDISLVTTHTKAAKPTKIAIGTHALLHREEYTKNASLVTIDEQHRFGVHQRAKLSAREFSTEKIPHILTMSATPIPRTIALTLYGDTDTTSLTELPQNRKVVKTWVLGEEKRAKAHEWIEKTMNTDKSQAYIVCPLIEEGESETKSVKKEFEEIKKLHPKKTVGLLHGKLKPAEKERVLTEFKDKKTDILVATPVIEVGIDVPNSTIIVIEGAERFGLAQLHQLRGRVGRGDKQSYCLLFCTMTNKNIEKRLKAFETIQNGFELAEYDLSLRGPGEIFGTKQSGLPELYYATWQDVDLIKKTKELANEVLSNPEKYKEIVKYSNEQIIVEN